MLTRLMDYESSHRERLLRHARNYASSIQDDHLIMEVIVGGSLPHGGTDRESDTHMLAVVRDLPAVERPASRLTTITGEKVESASLSDTKARKWHEFCGPKDDLEQWGRGTGGGLFYFTEAEILRDLERADELRLSFIGRDELERPSHIEEHLADLAHGVILYDPTGFAAACQNRLARKTVSLCQWSWPWKPRASACSSRMTWVWARPSRPVSSSPS